MPGLRRPFAEIAESPRADDWSAARLDADATVALGRWLQAGDYRFTTPTPETQRRVLANRPGEARDLRDVFGWSRRFESGLLPAEALRLLERSGALQELDDGRLRSRIRFSSLADGLFVHSAYPTSAGDAVFFGPDTCRFAGLIRGTLAGRRRPAPRVVDIGCGSGAGGLLAARQLGPRMARLTLGDISPAALRCAAINSALSGVEAHCVESDVLDGVEGEFDLVLCNPPYLADPQQRLYRHGGGLHGCELSLRIVRETLPRLAPKGWLILYTGTAVVDGVDTFKAGVEPLLRSAGLRYRYEELDPDVFGEELEQAAYAGVERLAVVGLVVSAGAHQGADA
ncbi:MAG: class I SAM-dependent methyltransferase [Nevskia sp.]